MYKLMKLELRKIKMRPYILASIMASILLTVFIYFISFVAKVENEPDFQNYSNIFLFTRVISMIFFSILSAIMYSRFIIDEYRGEKLILQFTYPAKRIRILLAKIGVVTVFTIVAILISNIPPFVIFSMTEVISPIVQDSLSQELLFSTLRSIIISTLIVNGIGIIAMRIGFIKNSIPTTIVTALILCATVGNLIVKSTDNTLISMNLLGIMVLISIAITIELMRKVDRMEVE